MDILSKIVETKKEEVKDLYANEADLLEKDLPLSPISFYQQIDEKRNQNQAFFITEFKRKSPSAGTIEDQLDPVEQATRYSNIGTSAISVLTDHDYFGGSFDDLEAISSHIRSTGKNIVVLQKDFVIDPIQIYKARDCGANMILLIARILSPEHLKELKDIAQSLNMGALVEVHDEEEYEKIKHLNIEVLGINNRNLKTFKTRLNHFYHTLNHIDYKGHLIAESGIYNSVDYKLLSRKASGYLIGQSLMESKPNHSLDQHFNTDQTWIFKACGLRNQSDINDCTSDLIGVNFSPISKRRIDPKQLESVPSNAVAVFKDNSEEEILSTVKEHGFKYVQLYLEDINSALLDQIKCKIILAASIKNTDDIEQLKQFDSDCDLFILDGAIPGSGQSIDFEIPQDFNYPFLLAGGMNIDNLDRLKQHPMCIGVDMASGIEKNKVVDLSLIQDIKKRLESL